MCRSIKTLRTDSAPASADEIRAAALQFVRKISGFRSPALHNAETFEAAVDEIAHGVFHRSFRAEVEGEGKNAAGLEELGEPRQDERLCDFGNVLKDTEGDDGVEEAPIRRSGRGDEIVRGSMQLPAATFGDVVRPIREGGVDIEAENIATEGGEKKDGNGGGAAEIEDAESFCRLRSTENTGQPAGIFPKLVFAHPEAMTQNTVDGKARARKAQP